jgi:DNA repair protein RAD57
MSDIILVPTLPQPSSRILQALDNAGIQTVDLLTLDVFEIHRRTQLSVIDVQRLVKDVISTLSQSAEKEVKTAEQRSGDVAFLSTGDAKIDQLLGGGFPTSYLTEITGERLVTFSSRIAHCSGLGKSQLCLQLCIQAHLPRSLGGLYAGVIYIGTESSLATPRLSQIASHLISKLTTSPPVNIPAEDVEKAIASLEACGDRIFYYHCSDLEAQEHIVTYQLPVVLERFSIGLIILDSVTANYRGEFDRVTTSSQKPGAQMAQRSKDLRKLAGTLKDLAIRKNVAVVAVNQVLDAFKRSSSQAVNSSQEEELLALDYQAKWFDGLMEETLMEGTKRPALGLVWTNLITSRIMLVRDNPMQTRIKLVFSPFAKSGSLPYAISGDTGLYALEGREILDNDDADGVALEAVPGELWTDESWKIISSDFDLGTDDIEFAEANTSEHLSQTPNVLEC